MPLAVLKDNEVEFLDNIYPTSPAEDPEKEAVC